MGSLYKRRQRDGTLGGPWWCKFYCDGRATQVSTGTTKEQEARRFLREREGRVAMGQRILPRLDRVRYDEAAADLRLHWETSGERNLKEADDRLKPLAKFFNGRRLVAIDGLLAQKYVQARQAQGLSNGTINRELSVLGKVLRFAEDNGKLMRVPRLRLLKESSPRAGFFEAELLAAVQRRLRSDLQLAVALAYKFGWRMQSEVLTLQLRQVDLEAGTVRLDPGKTKNGKGRIVYLTETLKVQVAAQMERMRALARRRNEVLPYLFVHQSGRFTGMRVRDFRVAWKRATEAVGATGKLRHDLRRTAVRNMVNRGIPERVAMEVTGHRTRSVFDRYHIISPADLQEAARKLADPVVGTTAGTTPPSALDASREVCEKTRGLA